MRLFSATSILIVLFMIKKTFLSCAVFIGICHLIVGQQIATNGAMSLEALIQSTLGQGCVEISNISSSINGSLDDISSFGRFAKEQSNFPFQNGLILATGSVASAGNALNTNVLSEGTRSWGRDPDLEIALGITQTTNATSIEFDFISASNQIAFNYLLASEEYSGTNPCLYSDGFAFLIKEAGTSNPYSNIAIIPGTATPVNTQTIRPQIVGHCPAENLSYFEGYNVGDTNYNGQTKVLTATAGIKPNVAYHIKLVIADQKDWRYDSAVFIQGNSFDATVNLGPDLVTCASSVTLNGSINNPLATYKWFRNGVLISAATNPTLVVTESGNYKVQVTVLLNTKTCEIEDDVIIALNVRQALDNIPDYKLCDDSSNNGYELFDLSTRNNQVLKSLPLSTYKISYHTTSDHAQSGNNPITVPLQSGPDPRNIFIRIEDVDNGCLSFTGVRLMVNQSPQITTPPILIVCDTDGTPDGTTEIDLSQVNLGITSNSNLIVTYHLYPEEANSGEQLLVSPFTNNNDNPDETERLYVRVYDPNTGCFSTTTLDVQVVNPPNIAIDKPYINACKPDGTGYESFDLSSIINELLENLTGVPDGFYETQQDAEERTNPIANSSNYQNIVQDFQIVYLRIRDVVSGCFSIVPIELHTNITLTGFITRDFNGCDDLSEDGFVDFNLYDIADSLLNGYEGFEVTFYESQTDQENKLNALNKELPYSVASSPHILYATASNDDCDNYVTINLVINPPILLPVLKPDPYCDTDQNGIEDVLLASFDSYVSQGIANASVQYYETEAQAYDNDPILEPYYYINNSETLYVRVTNTETTCFDIAPMTIEIVTPPLIIGFAEITVCDDDFDGYSIVNLESKIPEIVADTVGVTITFHNNSNLALSGEQPFLNPGSYNISSQYVAIRIEDNLTGCFSVGALYTYINTLPQFPNISNFINCEYAGTHVSDFYFYKKDEEILNGQTGKQVLYFKTLQDAEDRVNTIDKFTAYPSGTRTIFVRVEAITDTECYGTASFELEVGSLPPFKAPKDVFVCDDISNAGIITLDLSEKESEIRNGISSLDIVFYTSLEDAQDKNSPIPDLKNYTNSANPQSIYVRIENGTFCHSITTFTINVVQIPAVVLPSTLSKCGTNTNGSLNFDLSVVELEALPERPDNIVITYHESLEGAEADNQIITDPENYVNTSSPQTVYIKINNTVSNCYVNLPINLVVNFPPEIIDFKNYHICENTGKNFDLTAINNIITSEPNTIISYHSSGNDALNGIPLDNDYTYTTNNDRIYVRLENASTQCPSYYDFNLIVAPLPIANTANDLENCDDDFDGLFVFDLSDQTIDILGSQMGSNYVVSYHETQITANSGQNPLEQAYTATNGQLIYARVLNTTTGCFSTTQFSTIVNPLPIVNITDQVICIDNLPLVVTANTNIPTDRYLWSTGNTTSDIEIIAIGSYSVTVTSSFDCQTTQSFEVIASESATIETAETVDFSDPNNIKITISGIGNYLYILDEGPAQESNLFENVTLGYHTISIIDLNGCAEIKKEVVVIDAPKFVTPNSDGYFDTWHISGIETLPGSIIYIFDRYGKLITTLTSKSSGWNGRYNGHLLPASDYWYVGKIKKNNNTFEVKGHFALKL